MYQNFYRNLLMSVLLSDKYIYDKLLFSVEYHVPLLNFDSQH